METLEQNLQPLISQSLEQSVSVPLPETTPIPENESELLQKRIETAVGDCEIEPTAEVQEALRGYYGDHYALGSMIKAATTGEISDEHIEAILSLPDGVVSSDQFDTFLDSYYFNSQTSAESTSRLLAKSIKRERDAKSENERVKQHTTTLQLAWGALSKVLFQENSLGITTISDPELEQVKQLHGMLTKASSETDIYVSPHGGNSGRFKDLYSGDLKLENIEKKINKVKSKFWEDVRYAGQLEFHNTSNLEGIVGGGGLMSRTEQFRRNGYMMRQTAANDKMHSIVPHFGEKYDPFGYKGLLSNRSNTEKGNGKGAGTVALPLAEIIKIAPFARDAQYAVVRPREDRNLSKVPMKTNERLGEIGAGSPDYIDSDGHDRVFFASPTQENGVKPDQYSIPIDAEHGVTLIFIGGERDDSEHYGLGEGMARRLEIESKDSALEQVADLQKQYLEKPAYKGRLIVPLRRGVFDYYAEGMASPGWRKEPNYNDNPLLQK